MFFSRGWALNKSMGRRKKARSRPVVQTVSVPVSPRPERPESNVKEPEPQEERKEYQSSMGEKLKFLAKSRTSSELETEGQVEKPAVDFNKSIEKIEDQGTRVENEGETQPKNDRTSSEVPSAKPENLRQEVLMPMTLLIDPIGTDPVEFERTENLNGNEHKESEGSSKVQLDLIARNSDEDQLKDKLEEFKMQRESDARHSKDSSRVEHTTAIDFTNEESISDLANKENEPFREEIIDAKNGRVGKKSGVFLNGLDGSKQSEDSEDRNEETRFDSEKVVCSKSEEESLASEKLKEELQVDSETFEENKGQSGNSSSIQELGNSGVSEFYRGCVNIMSGSDQKIDSNQEVDSTNEIQIQIEISKNVHHKENEPNENTILEAYYDEIIKENLRLLAESNHEVEKIESERSDALNPEEYELKRVLHSNLVEVLTDQVAESFSKVTEENEFQEKMNKDDLKKVSPEEKVPDLPDLKEVLQETKENEIESNTEIVFHSENRTIEKVETPRKTEIVESEMFTSEVIKTTKTFTSQEIPSNKEKVEEEQIIEKEKICTYPEETVQAKVIKVNSDLNQSVTERHRLEREMEALKKSCHELTVQNRNYFIKINTLEEELSEANRILKKVQITHSNSRRLSLKFLKSVFHLKLCIHKLIGSISRKDPFDLSKIDQDLEFLMKPDVQAFMGFEAKTLFERNVVLKEDQSRLESLLRHAKREPKPDISEKSVSFTDMRSVNDNFVLPPDDLKELLLFYFQNKNKEELIKPKENREVREGSTPGFKRSASHDLGSLARSLQYKPAHKVAGISNFYAPETDAKLRRQSLLRDSRAFEPRYTTQSEAWDHDEQSPPLGIRNLDSENFESDFELTRRDNEENKLEENDYVKFKLEDEADSKNLRNSLNENFDQEISPEKKGSHFKHRAYSRKMDVDDFSSPKQERKLELVSGPAFSQFARDFRREFKFNQSTSIGKIELSEIQTVPGLTDSTFTSGISPDLEQNLKKNIDLEAKRERERMVEEMEKEKAKLCSKDLDDLNEEKEEDALNEKNESESQGLEMGQTNPFSMKKRNTWSIFSCNYYSKVPTIFEQANASPRERLPSSSQNVCSAQAQADNRFDDSSDVQGESQNPFTSEIPGGPGNISFAGNMPSRAEIFKEELPSEMHFSPTRKVGRTFTGHMPSHFDKRDHTETVYDESDDVIKKSQEIQSQAIKRRIQEEVDVQVNEERLRVLRHSISQLETSTKELLKQKVSQKQLIAKFGKLHQEFMDLRESIDGPSHSIESSGVFGNFVVPEDFHLLQKIYESVQMIPKISESLGALGKKDSHKTHESKAWHIATNENDNRLNSEGLSRSHVLTPEVEEQQRNFKEIYALIFKVYVEIFTFFASILSFIKQKDPEKLKPMKQRMREYYNKLLVDNRQYKEVFVGTATRKLLSAGELQNQLKNDLHLWNEAFNSIKKFII